MRTLFIKTEHSPYLPLFGNTAMLKFNKNELQTYMQSNINSTTLNIWCIFIYSCLKNRFYIYGATISAPHILYGALKTQQKLFIYAEHLS